jgi:pyroglutamyl-peptidase
MSVLVTGFGRYGDQTSNPSELLARALDGQRIAGETTTGVVLPVATVQVGGALATAISNARPRIVVALGVAPGRTAPSLERVAINVRDFPIPDTDGAQPVDQPVVADGPDAYFTTLPVKMILFAWRTAELPGYISNTAGTYVCNQVFYLVSHLARQDGFRAGFIHLPAVPAVPAPVTATVPGPSMSLERMEEAVRTAVAVTAGHDGPDLPLAGGTVS